MILRVQFLICSPLLKADGSISYHPLDALIKIHAGHGPFRASHSELIYFPSIF